MPTDLTTCSRLLSEAGIRHHVDPDQGVIRVVFVTRHYRNARGERVAVLTLDTPDDGRSCRVRLERAFPAGDDPGAICLTLCRLAADLPGVGFRYDDASRSITLALVSVVEDARLTAAQLCGILDRLVLAAEACQRHLGDRAGRRRAA